MISRFDPISLRYVKEKLDDILAIIDAYGISINVQSRFNRFKIAVEKELIQQMDNPIEVLGEDSFSKSIDFVSFLRRMTTLGQGLRDFYELWSITSSQVVMKDNVRELALIFGGNVNPRDDKLTNTRPRDIQYQLFLTSVFELSGFHVLNAEPDFIFVHGKEEIAVACKRINSRKQAFSRVKDAAKQITESGRRGFIALSLDNLVEINFYQHTTDSQKLNQFATELLKDYFSSTFEGGSLQFDKNILGLIINMGAIGGDILTERLNYSCACEMLIINHGDSKMNESLMGLGRKIILDATKLI